MRLLIYALYTYIVAVRAVLYIFEKSSYEVVLTVRLVTYKCICEEIHVCFSCQQKYCIIVIMIFQVVFQVLEENTER